MKKVQIDGLGEITFKKSARAKYIRLRVAPFQGVVVTVPKYLNYEFGINAVMGKFDWLRQQLDEASRKEQELAYTPDQFPMKLRFYTVKLQTYSGDALRRRFKDGVVTLFLPDSIGLNERSSQEYISESVNKVLRQEAKMHLTGRLTEFSTQHKLPINRITIRDTKTRWGSCSYDNNISLSFHLMKLPDHLIDYVLLHELAHTKEKNHQKPFWNLLEQLCDGHARKWDKELKQYNHLILR